MAEIILMNAASKSAKKPLDISLAAKEMQKWFKEKFALPKEKFKLINGSGLGDGNLLTPTDLNKILAKHYMELWPRLPINAIKGWLRRRLNTPKDAFRVWAKTGSLDYTSALSGVILTPKKKTLLFTIFINDICKNNRGRRFNAECS